MQDLKIINDPDDMPDLAELLSQVQQVINDDPRTLDVQVLPFSNGWELQFFVDGHAEPQLDLTVYKQ